MCPPPRKGRISLSRSRRPCSMPDGGPERLVAGPDVEVRVQRAQVHRHLRHRLGAVHERERAGGAGAARDLLDGVDRAEHVRHVPDRHQLHPALGEHGVELVERQLAALRHRQVAQPRPGLLAEELPGHDVRVVLHLGDEHLVAGADVAAAPGVGDEVDGLGGVAGEDRAVGVPAHERGDALARALEQLGGLPAELVHAAVDRAVGVGVEAVHRLDHLARLLRARGGVEVDELMAVDLPLQHREVGAQVDERALGDGAHQAASARSPMNSRTCSSAPFSFSAIRRRTRSSRPGSSRRCTTSSKYPSTSTRTASPRDRPRVIM